MVFVVVIGVLVVIAGIMLVVLPRLQEKKERDAAGNAHHFVDPLMTDEYRIYGPTSLGAGAIIGRAGTDHVVRGTLAYTEGPFRWWEHLLDGGRDGAWFGVEEDEGAVELTWWRRLPGAFDPVNPIVIDGVEYYEDDRGRAKYTATGTTGLPPEGTMEYIDYESRDGRLLGLERWTNGSGQWEASLGERILPGELNIFPAPKNNGTPPAGGPQ